MIGVDLKPLLAATAANTEALTRLAAAIERQADEQARANEIARGVGR